MAYHTGNKKKPMTKKPMNKKPMKKPMKKSSKLSEKQMKQLETHSKKHKGGMSSTHIKNMKKFMMAGDSFIVSHNKAVKLDKK
jgi:hypothetical protein